MTLFSAYSINWANNLIIFILKVDKEGRLDARSFAFSNICNYNISVLLLGTKYLLVHHQSFQIGFAAKCYYDLILWIQCLEKVFLLDYLKSLRHLSPQYSQTLVLEDYFSFEHGKDHFNPFFFNGQL